MLRVIRPLIIFLPLFVLILADSADARRETVLPPVTKGDLELMQQKAQVEMADKPAGTVLKWSNEKSGNSGAVVLIQSSEIDGLPCREILHIIKLKADSFARRYALTICNTAEGEWKMR